METDKIKRRLTDELSTDYTIEVYKDQENGVDLDHNLIMDHTGKRTVDIKTG